MSKPSGQPFDLKLLFRIYRLTKPYRGLFWITVVSTLLLAALSPFRAWLIQETIDKEISHGDASGLMLMAFWMFITLLIQSVIQFGQAWFAGFIGQNIIRELRVRVFKHISHYRSSKLDQTPVGTLVTRNISDLETLAEVFNEGLISIVGDLFQIVFIVGLMFYTHWQLTLVSLSVLPLLLYAGYIFKNAVKASFIQTRLEVTRLNTFVQEHIQGMQVVQIFNRKLSEYRKFESINAAHRDAQNKGVFAYAVFFPVVEIITAVSTALLVWYGVEKLTDQPPTLTLGVLTAFLMLINMFFRPVRQLADRFNTLQMGMVAAERIFVLLDEKEVTERTHGLECHLQGEIVFEDVYFQYRDNQPVLKGISFEVPIGKTLALVGPTGAGKSSVIGLVNNSYTAVSGKVTIDGTPVESIHPQSLRSQLATVQQDVFLFTGSIRDNITLFDAKYSQEEVEDAARKVGIHPYISTLPNGYQTYVHERGATLSTGQRQLIAFARAMLTRPRILILDEATANVDSESESLIQQAIKVLMEGRTCIIIAHRLSTILHADEILVLEHGTIAERGNHQSLMQQNGIYKRMFELQFSE